MDCTYAAINVYRYWLFYIHIHIYIYVINHIIYVYYYYMSFQCLVVPWAHCLGSMSVFDSGIGNGKGPVSPDTSVIWLHLDVSVQFSTPKSSAEKKKTLKKGLARC